MIGLGWGDLELVAGRAGERLLCPYCRRWRRCLWRLAGEEGAYCGPCWARALGPPAPGRAGAGQEGARCAD